MTEIAVIKKPIKQASKKDIANLNWRPGSFKEKKEKASKLTFYRLSYDGRLEYCLRSEETKLIDKEVWQEINLHLGASVKLNVI